MGKKKSRSKREGKKGLLTLGGNSRGECKGQSKNHFGNSTEEKAQFTQEKERSAKEEWEQRTPRGEESESVRPASPGGAKGLQIINVPPKHQNAAAGDGARGARKRGTNRK